MIHQLVQFRIFIDGIYGSYPFQPFIQIAIVKRWSPMLTFACSGSYLKITKVGDEDEKGAFANRLNFETYNLGHLMMAGIVHYRATGKRTLFDAAVKATDFLCHFYETASAELARNAICPSHYMGVVEMYRATKNPRYLELSRNLINIRGMVENGTDDNQDRIPFRAQKQAMGHAVRANYLYAGVADVYAETGEKLLMENLLLSYRSPPADAPPNANRFPCSVLR